MTRLPAVAGDNDGWGTVLNDFLSVSHNSDGTLKTSAISGGSLGVITPEQYGAVGGGVANDTVPMQNALAAAAASSQKTPIYLSNLYRTTSALTPFTGMRMVGLGRGSEFGYGSMIRNGSTDLFTPSADVSDIHLEGIQFEGNTGTLTTDWWTQGTGYQIQYSHIDKCGFTGFKQVYVGNWTGVTFENFYTNGCKTTVPQFDVGGADSIFGPGFIGQGGYNRTTLTASVTAGAGPKTITVADATGAVIGNPVYIGNQADGASPTRDVSIITNIAGTTLTIGTLANAHSSGEYVHLIMDTPAVEIQLSHSLIQRLYISPGPGMALHVNGGHSSTFLNCELSGHPAVSAGPGLYVIGSTGHQFIATVCSDVAFKAWNQFNGALVIYDSEDLNFSNTIFDNITSSTPNLYRLGRSGAGGAILTDKIRISGTSYYTVTSGAVKLSGNAAMTAADRTIDFDEHPKSKAGVPTDADFANLARSGFTITDTTNNRFYSRVGTTWKYSALT